MRRGVSSTLMTARMPRSGPVIHTKAVSPGPILSRCWVTCHVRVGFGSASRSANRKYSGLHLKIQNAIASALHIELIVRTPSARLLEFGVEILGVDDTELVQQVPHRREM